MRETLASFSFLSFFGIRRRNLVGRYIVLKSVHIEADDQVASLSMSLRATCKDLAAVATIGLPPAATTFS